MRGLLAASAQADRTAQRPAGADSSERSWHSTRGLAVDTLEVAFYEDLDVWLGWVRGVATERKSMCRLVVTYSAGWVAVTGATLAIPWLGAPAAAASAALLFATLLVAFELTLASADWTDSPRGSASADEGRPMCGPDERARLIRIMNLSRCATLPAVRPLLRDELREALSQEPLASWPALRRFEEALGAGAFS